jgi:micrococcal nuclease
VTATSTPTSTATPATSPSAETPSQTTASQKTEWTVTVSRVIDGDTLEVEFSDGHVEDVRLLGVDTPEVHTENDPAEFEEIPETTAGNEWLRDWGHKASEFARTQLLGKQIMIRTDPQADRRGSYGRLLVYVSHDGRDFNQALIEQGYARLYESQFQKRDTYANLEETARANNVGLWNFQGATATTIPDGGTQSSIDIVEIHADASGNDHENLNDEYLVLKNTGNSDIDLSGWTVSDEAGHTYRFPTGFTLGPNDRVTLYTGAGTDTETELYWGSESAVWNNGGDTIIITNDSGEEMVTRQYS